MAAGEKTGLRALAGRSWKVLLSTLSPTLCSRVLFRRIKGARLDLNDPKTLDEKLMWLKLRYYRDGETVTQCADKYRVREYVRQAGCGALLNDLIGVYDRPEDIPWDSLPDRFALKCNHGCGYNLLCTDAAAFDRAAAARRLKRWLREDYWRLYAEINYRRIPKKIVCEAYLEGENGQPPADYKFYCFHGRPDCVLVCVERAEYPRFYFFDRSWQLLRINPDGQAAPEDFTLPRPAALEAMFDYAARLSAPFPFVRVDLYALEERVVFGELTFTPSMAMDAKRLPETDRAFGDLLTLPEENGEPSCC